MDVSKLAAAPAFQNRTTMADSDQGAQRTDDVLNLEKVPDIRPLDVPGRLTRHVRRRRNARRRLSDPDFSHIEGWTMPTGIVDSTHLTLRRIGLGVIFLWFLFGGVAHFALTDTEMKIMPPYVPWPHAMVLVSGVFELLGAAGILIPFFRRAAGVGLFLLTLAVTPANVYMLQHAALFNVPYWLLVARLPFQALLLWLIVWSTWPRAPYRGRI